MRWLKKACDGAERIFLDLDCDVFEPMFFPAVTQPVPFGLSPSLFLRLLEAISTERLAGIAFSEFDPRQDRNDACLGTLMWLLEYLLLRRYEQR